MIMEGCQGKRGPEIEEVACPACGEMIELAATDVMAACDKCGHVVYSDLMNCVFTCPKARACVGDERYEQLMAAREEWEQQLAAMADDDEW